MLLPDEIRREIKRKLGRHWFTAPGYNLPLEPLLLSVRYGEGDSIRSTFDRPDRVFITTEGGERLEEGYPPGVYYLDKVFPLYTSTASQQLGEISGWFLQANREDRAWLSSSNRTFRVREVRGYQRGILLVISLERDYLPQLRHVTGALKACVTHAEVQVLKFSRSIGNE